MSSTTSTASDDQVQHPSLPGVAAEIRGVIYGFLLPPSLEFFNDPGVHPSRLGFRKRFRERQQHARPLTHIAAITQALPTISQRVSVVHLAAPSNGYTRVDQPMIKQMQHVQMVYCYRSRLRELHAYDVPNLDTLMILDGFDIPERADRWKETFVPASFVKSLSNYQGRKVVAYQVCIFRELIPSLTNTNSGVCRENTGTAPRSNMSKTLSQT